MTVDRSQWLASIEKEAAQRPAAPPLIHPAFAQHLRAVAARLEHLTDGDAWTVYRAQLETLIEELEQQIDIRRAEADELFDADLLRARLALADLRGQVKGIRTALQAPDIVQKVASGAA